MTEHSKNPNQTMWMKFKHLLQELDQTIERIIQQTVDDWEKTYRKELENES